MTRAPKILVVSYYFPPDAAVGGLRAAKFVRTLKELGWNPSVLTVKDERRERLDKERMEGLAGVRIVAIDEPPTLRGIFTWAKSWLTRLRRTKGPAKAIEPRSGPATEGLTKESLNQRVKRYVISLVVFLPDDKKGWSFWAGCRAVWMIRTQGIEYLLTSGPPESIHLAGVLATTLTRVKWVADFRDPWIDQIEDRSRTGRSRASDAIERAMERRVMVHADLVVTTNDWLREALVARYPSLPPAKFACVPNSLDTERFRTASSVEKYRPLTITYAGTLYFGRTPEPLFRAVSDLIHRRGVAASDIRIKLLGECKYIEGVETAEVARENGLEDVVEVLDPVPYSEALSIMRKSHLLLIIAPDNHRLCVPAKLFDYLGSGSKVLALTAPGATADLIAATDSGVCFAQTDTDRLADYLYPLATSRKAEELRNAPESFARYDVRTVTREFADRLLALRDGPHD